jgi:hypothetical protein
MPYARESFYPRKAGSVSRPGRTPMALASTTGSGCRSLNPPLQEGFERWLLVRRSVEDPEELTAYTVFCVEGTTLGALARVAGSRWRVEIGFEEAKGEVGQAHYEVRSWHGWYRHVTLSLFAHALLAAIRAEGIDIEAPQKGASKPEGKDGLLAFKRKRGLSCN